MLQGFTTSFDGDLTSVKAACHASAYAENSRHHFSDGTPHEQINTLIDEQCASYSDDLVARTEQDAGDDPASDTLLSADVTKFMFENKALADAQELATNSSSLLKNSDGLSSWKVRTDYRRTLEI
jgi:hypothetical protein